MRRSQTLLLTIIGGAMLLLACSPSAKNEQQAWDNLQKDAAEFKLTWPSFTAPIDAQLKIAEPAMAEALKLTDEKEKAKKMKAVNEQAGVLMGRLNEVKYKSEGLNKMVTKLADLKLPKDKANERKEAMNKASTVVNEVHQAMLTAAPTNQEEAMAVCKAQIDKLISSQGDADRAYDSLKPKKAKKAKKK